MFNKKIAQEMTTELGKSSKDLAKNLKVLEDHLIQVQENQVEFENYLTEILLIVKNIAIKQNVDYPKNH